MILSNLETLIRFKNYGIDGSFANSNSRPIKRLSDAGFIEGDMTTPANWRRFRITSRGESFLNEVEFELKNK